MLTDSRVVIHEWVQLLSAIGKRTNNLPLLNILNKSVSEALYISFHITITITNTTNISHYYSTTILQPGQPAPPQLRMEDFVAAVLLPTCPCLWQLAHSDYEVARILFNGITCAASIPLL